MNITVEVSDDRITSLVKQRIGELFSDDARFRDTGTREFLRRIVDKAVGEAVCKAKDAIAAEIPGMAEKAVRTAIECEMEKAATRGLNTIKKLFVGFNPAKLSPEQVAWLRKQIEAGVEANLNPATSKPDGAARINQL